MPKATPRAQVLRLAILSALTPGPQHGYALRKSLNLSLGTFRTLSYGSLYPALRKLEEEGYIVAEDEPATPMPLRRRVTYTLTQNGKDYLNRELSTVTPGDWDDTAFDVRFSMFSSTKAPARLRILEGRYAKIMERKEALRQWTDTATAHADAYVSALTEHTLEQINNELTWLEKMINLERRATHTSAS